jgi:predicted helicase
MQGVSINILIKTGKEKTQLGNLYHSELYGLRDYKFESLNKSDIHNIKWNKLNYIEPYYFFVPKDFGENIEYEKGFKINELFKINTSGVKTHHDDELVSFNKFEDNNYQYYYRPFDTRWIEYDLNKVIRHRFSVMKHMIKENISLLTCKQQSSFAFQHVLVARVISDICSVSLQTKESTYAFPLYLYSEDGTKIPNLNQEIVTEIEKTVGKTTPEDILDYIYAVLHSPTYREKYKEFLKIDFPRVPYPKDKDTFKKLVALGNELRSLHLLESPKVNRYITSYPIEGTDTVEKITLEKTSPEKGNVYINQTQYFGGVPEIAWTFFIGGYQPAQKWLKDRKGRTLTNEDIEHYQKIIVSLSETHRIMSEINNINF